MTEKERAMLNDLIASLDNYIGRFWSLQNEIDRLSKLNRELLAANNELIVERDAADVLLGAAMDEVLSIRRRGNR